ncbi:MAG TPA: ABC transporter substrate-binding protein [Deltaproteobacteria bacterium]|nr:ABC transporter substrate-binding protein [Deltaproteobacteria bacterium]HOI06661.1 ABC transporter substrate-binding protein [Deltaproteobacteria bacterium]
MKKGILVCLCLVMAVGFSMSCFAADKSYRIEVLQVTKIEPFDNAFNSFVKALADRGLVQGKNLTIKRTIIDFDIEKAGLWKKISVLMRIRSEASRIAGEKPDLVLTIGTPATKYAKDKITAAGIPLVFSAVAYPVAAGCKSMTEAGPGFTGATLYMDMKDILNIIKLAFPKATTMGIIHSDDENAVAQVEEARKVGASMGLTFVTKLVGKSDRITPAAKELAGKGVQLFVVPLDTYYALRNNEASLELYALRRDVLHIPAIGLGTVKIPGAVLYTGSDFGYIGGLSGQQAAKILKDGVKPDTLPILRQKDLIILVDQKAYKEFNVQLPMELLRLAKPLD